MLDAEALAAIRQRAEKATPAPWHPFVSPWPDKMHAVTAVDEGGPPIAYVGNRVLGGPANDANLDFIAHARTDVPALLAEVERLRAEVERYALLASVTTSERLAGVEVPPDVTGRLLAEQERDEARAALARAEQQREQYRVALGTVLVAMTEPGLLRTDLDLQAVVRAALAGRDASEEAT